MGLLDGLSTLQGPPPASPSPSSSEAPLSQVTTSARTLFTDLQTTLSNNLPPQLTASAKNSTASIRTLFTPEPPDLECPPEQQSLGDEFSSMLNLTLLQRLTLFAMIFGTGIFLIGLSFTFLPIIVLVPHKFAATFTMGNLLAISSTCILIGPKAQFQTMFHPARAAAAVAYLGALVAALLAAFFGGRLRYPLVLGALVVEILSCTSSNYYIFFTYAQKHSFCWF